MGVAEEFAIAKGGSHCPDQTAGLIGEASTMTKSPKISSRKARSAKPRATPKRTRKNKTAPKVVAAEKVAHRATDRKASDEGGRDTWNTALLGRFPSTQAPNTFRVLAERNVAQTRELYEGSQRIGTNYSVTAVGTTRTTNSARWKAKLIRRRARSWKSDGSEADLPQQPRRPMLFAEKLRGIS
jgi:hypothetical protein